LYECEASSMLGPVVRDCFWDSERPLYILIAAVECVCRRGLGFHVGAPGRPNARQLHDSDSAVLGVQSLRASANGHSGAKARHFDSKSVCEIFRIRTLSVE
jgi:hypothetical protein